MNSEELIETLRSRDFWVFGTGYVAETFWYALERHALIDRVRGFLVSRGVNGVSFHGLPVLSLSPGVPGSGETVCLAVHDSAAGEILPLLSGRTEGLYRIYPLLTELCYGAPRRETESRSPKELLNCQGPEDLWLAVRYAVIRDYLSGGETLPLAAALYVRSMALHCGMATAERRLRFLYALADSMSAKGWREGTPVFIDERGRIIDGLHRTACGIYLGLEGIACRVYPASEIYDRLLGERNRLPQSFLLAQGFSAEELTFLRRTQTEMQRRCDDFG